MVKDYGHLLKDDREFGHVAAEISGMTMDISQLLAEIGIETSSNRPQMVAAMIAYHSACSLQHGQKIHDLPQQLLRSASLVNGPVNPHLYCGSAGVYNILQPDMADGLRTRKLDSIRQTGQRGSCWQYRVHFTVR